MAKRIRYNVAMSLDGFISGPQGEADWILRDPEMDFAALWAQFDTWVMGRKTYAASVARLGVSVWEGKRVFVASRTMRAEECPGVTVVRELDAAWVRRLREGAAKDVWVVGGGVMFGAMLRLGAVDEVEVTVMPVLLGEGVPLMTGYGARVGLRLVSERRYGSGVVSLRYEVVR